MAIENAQEEEERTSGNPFKGLQDSYRGSSDMDDFTLNKQQESDQEIADKNPGARSYPGFDTVYPQQSAQPRQQMNYSQPLPTPPGQTPPSSGTGLMPDSGSSTALDENLSKLLHYYNNSRTMQTPKPSGSKPSTPGARDTGY